MPKMQLEGVARRGEMIQTVYLPLRTRSESNLREHWASKGRRTKSLRHGTYWGLMAQWGKMDVPEEGMTIRLTRIAPRKLDSDNLAGALKAVRDGVADYLAVDDGDPRLRWEYDQRRGKKKEYGVSITLDKSRSL